MTYRHCVWFLTEFGIFGRRVCVYVPVHTDWMTCSPLAELHLWKFNEHALVEPSVYHPLRDDPSSIIKAPVLDRFASLRFSASRYTISVTGVHIWNQPTRENGSKKVHQRPRRRLLQHEPICIECPFAKLYLLSHWFGNSG